MDPTTVSPPSAQSSPQADAWVETQLSARWMIAVGAGCLAGLPIGWLLAFGALLPFYLGLFFFVLLGLVLGAIVFRIGQVDRPLPRRRIVIGTGCVLAVTWLASLTTEARVFPGQVAQMAVEQYPKLPEGTTLASFRATSTAGIVNHLQENYAPGGLIGYARWAITSSRLDPPVGQLRKPFVASQGRFGWSLRVLLSALLLGYGIYSQLSALTRPDTPREHMETYVNPLSKM